jgi:thioredoxin 1
MPFSPYYQEVEPERSELDRASGWLLVEFGAVWCGHCLALEPALKKELADRPDVQHLRIADGRGKPLGRSFRVKLWPTLVLLQDGQVMGQLVRPSQTEIVKLFAEIPRGSN